MSHTQQTDSLSAALQQDIETLLQISTSLILVFTPQGKILAANAAAARIFGYASNRLAGKNIFKIFKTAGSSLETDMLQVTDSHDAYPFEETYKGCTISGILLPILDAQGGIDRVALLARDNTELLGVEEQLLVLTQEKESAGRLAELSRVLVEYAYDYSGLLEHISDGIAQQIGDACIIGIFSEGAA